MFNTSPTSESDKRVRRRGMWWRTGAVTLAALPVLALAPPGSASGTDVGAAQEALSAATQHRVETEARLLEVETQVSELRAQLDRLDSGAAQITEELAAARRAVREYAVAAYIDGGKSALLTSALQVAEGDDLAWSAQILGSQTSEAGDAVDRFEALKAANEPDRIAAAARLDELSATLADARNDLIQASAHERDAEAALSMARDYEARQAAEAEASARAQASSAASRSTSQQPERSQSSSSAPAPRAGATARPAPTPPAPVSATGSPSAAEQQMLAKIRQCESRGSYSIVSASGKYRGAYQFDRRTWQSVGGTGDPAAASPAEQDYRALLLYRERGRRPWPNCA
jgi:peptidoglycan hydrolase CwlO-like protein